MKMCLKLSALGVVLALTTAFASANTIQLGSYAQNGGNGGLPNTALAEVPPPAFAFANGTPNQFIPPPINGETQFLQVSNTNTWNLPLGNSSWVSYAQTGPESGAQFIVAPNGNYFFNTTFDLGVTSTPGDASGFLDVQADDTVIVFLNGNQLNTPSPSGTDPSLFPHCLDGTPNCMVGTMIDLDSADFISGINTLTFQVVQGNASDFGVDFTGAVNPVPEPSSLFLLGTGLIGSAGALLRRKRS